jgi:hypothetical protein
MMKADVRIKDLQVVLKGFNGRLCEIWYQDSYWCTAAALIVTLVVVVTLASSSSNIYHY